VDESGRLRVIEGWHPSEPSQVGYNLVVDGDWFGTFGTLDAATTATAPHADIKGQEGCAPAVPGSRAPGGRSIGAGLHLVQPVPDED
jgi:hypothetical protein